MEWGNAGLCRNELFTLTDTDLDFGRDLIRMRAINAKTNQPRQIPMTPRVKLELQKVVGKMNQASPLAGARM